MPQRIHCKLTANDGPTTRALHIRVDVGEEGVDDGVAPGVFIEGYGEEAFNVSLVMLDNRILVVCETDEDETVTHTVLEWEAE